MRDHNPPPIPPRQGSRSPRASWNPVQTCCVPIQKQRLDQLTIISSCLSTTLFCVDTFYKASYEAFEVQHAHQVCGCCNFVRSGPASDRDLLRDLGMIFLACSTSRTSIISYHITYDEPGHVSARRITRFSDSREVSFQITVRRRPSTSK